MLRLDCSRKLWMGVLTATLLSSTGGGATSR